MTPARRTFVAVAGALTLTAAVFLWYRSVREAPPLSVTDPAAYEELVRTFYRGLASLDTGLLDNAKNDFIHSAEIAPGEPATWANLGVARLRGAEFGPAGDAIARAVALAPRSADIAILQSALESAHGRLDAAASSLRRAVDLDPMSARARFALADVVERAAGPDADTDAQRQLEPLVTMVPDNLAVLVERARLAAKRRDATVLADSVTRLEDAEAASSRWPAAAQDQLGALQGASSGGDFPAAQRAIAFLRNVLARVPEFRNGLAAVRVPAELVADPLDIFLTLPAPNSNPSPSDSDLTYTITSLDEGPATRMLAWPVDVTETPGLFAADPRVLRRLGTSGRWPVSGGTVLLPLDWNHDFRTDLLTGGPGGVTLLAQDDAGGFVDRTRASGLAGAVGRRVVIGAWAADLDMDGDLDLVIGIRGSRPVVMRNNGDGTARSLNLFGDVTGLQGFAWSDVDADGDPDPALLDGDGIVHVFTNQQAGAFDQLATLSVSARAIASADLDADGVTDLLTIDTQGVIRQVSRIGARWDVRPLATWGAVPPDPLDEVRLLVEDLDNNGGLDLVAAGGGTSGVWLSGVDGGFQPLKMPTAVDVFGVADMDADGHLDLVGLSGGLPVELHAQATLPYHWQTVRPRAQTSAGDERINSFGVGGEIEVRSGLLVQKQALTGAPVHVGLGARTGVDVARIVWPNGVMQAEFDLGVDQTVVAEQRLKGSCPWVFADNGEGLQFVTDFLWRSPLGLRINAQDTAGITQTEDRVKIRGDQLVARGGRYDIRITAELWETHFFDHVSLMVVDHPEGSDVFVDERFARTPPLLTVQAMTPPTPVSAAWDDSGRDVRAEVAVRDGRHVAGFERGVYQGLTAEHGIELEIGADAPREGPLWLVAQGWVYPTDSSINVAIAQAGLAPPHGLALDVLGADGAWRTLDPDLGFPAGKNKTILVDLSLRPAGARRFRLRTTMEIYWDALAWAVPAPQTPQRVTRLAATAELRYRGFSRTSEDRAAHAPETPRYAELANTAPRWRDLVGYHTRFGDVSELLTDVDDRYVIMNAGDELRLSFDAPPAPPAGWRRDFVLVGDGWEKDGDFNTGYSRTVLPLPRHGHPDYTAASLELEQDPVYLRHPDDWQRFHTRFVSPDRYLSGLWVTRRTGTGAAAGVAP